MDQNNILAVLIHKLKPLGVLKYLKLLLSSLDNLLWDAYIIFVKKDVGNFEVEHKTC